MFALLAAAVAAAAPPPDPRGAKIAAAYELVGAGKVQESLDAIEPVIADFEKENARRKERVYCGMSATQTLAYMLMAASEKKSAVALGPEFCGALYLKSFVLIELKRVPEAQSTLRYLLTFAPNHARYWIELGQSYAVQADWPKMLQACTTAEASTDMADPDLVKREKGAAWRCMGYALIEQAKWDEAAALYNKCVALDPNDAKAQHELRYIAEMRKKPKT
ncbi:MAG TPA: tetratricopeptide repeat protein [Sphingomicrobium sp.]|jgi:tetratricopeptide (TPR) repeat protein